MIVYNLTIKVHHTILEGWLAWAQQVHIPAVLSTGSFDDYELYQLLEQDESEGPTFVLQYYTSSLERYRQYIDEFASKMQQDAFAKWGEGFIAFDTVMKVL